MQRMVADARRTLLDALTGKGWTLTRLHRRARLRCSRSSLHRKLFGYVGLDGRHTFQPLHVAEYRRLARALGVMTVEDAEHVDQIERLGLRGAA